jgi:hypothetical protein
MENKLPESITIGERVFVLNIWQAEETNEILPDWWFVSYDPEDKMSLPAEVHNKEYWYFLSSADETREGAIADMEERISTMIIDEQTIARNVVKHDRTAS